MALPFFRALNPVSTESGTIRDGSEVIDHTVDEHIRLAFSENLNYFEGVLATFEILVGTHFSLDNADRKGIKGALDYLVFPLIARKLVEDTYLDERENSTLANALAWTIAAPLELLRFSAGFALALLLAPIVAIIHAVRACLPPHDAAEMAATIGVTP